MQINLNYKLSPSDFAFLWEECKRCFYLKVKKGACRPFSPMPGIFSVIDSRMKACFQGQSTSKISSQMPAGVIEDIETDWVESLPIELNGANCYLSGKIDTLVKWQDGSYGVIDFKTSSVRPENLEKYSRQLHAYAHALERSTGRRLSRQPVSRLGLVVYEPDIFEKDGEDRSRLSGNLVWHEIERNDGKFMSFIKEVLDLLERDTLPQSAPNCAFCAYRGLE